MVASSTLAPDKKKKKIPIANITIPYLGFSEIAQKSLTAPLRSLKFVNQKNRFSENICE